MTGEFVNPSSWNRDVTHRNLFQLKMSEEGNRIFDYAISCRHLRTKKNSSDHLFHPAPGAFGYPENSPFNEKRL